MRQLRNVLDYTGKDSRKWYALQKEIYALQYDKKGTWQALNCVSDSLQEFGKMKSINFSRKKLKNN